MNRDFYKEQLEIHIPRAKKRTILKNKIKCKSLKLLINEILENISSLSKKKKFIYSLKSKLIDWSFTLPTINDMTIGDNPYSQINYDNRQKDVKKAKEYISKLKSIYDKYVFECLPTDYIDGLNKFSEFIEGINCLQTRAVKREYIESRKKEVINDILSTFIENNLTNYIKLSTINNTTGEEYFFHKFCRLSINYKYEFINILDGQEIKAFKKVLSNFKTKNIQNKK